ncbi:hypothetical protein RHSIM_Rhsim05G0009700 [Rhododendron simsii]|uniref:Agglutinin domain-containing protein n=1 Tax=Rhododendron simsii TaxID=118357 RepID=A0A834GZR2_RHOSS|nr:hypothetical protein RHSIM_Rhsim05G0009700 [Rhododendron simsii]
MALELPRFAAFQSNMNQTYLRCNIQEAQKDGGFLEFSGEEIVSPYSKFEIERAKTTPAENENGFVHIRCCYNNKYWVANSSSNNSFIIAGADKPNEDRSQWSCTLFEPIGKMGTTDEGFVLFRHVHLRSYLTYPETSSPPGRACIYADSTYAPDDRLDNVFFFRDLESILILPKHIALKGDNGLYLSARWIEEHQYLEFTSVDNEDPRVANEVFITKDGKIRIKNNHFGKFWRCSPNWIWADSDDTTTNNLDTLFCPVKVGNNLVALRNLGNYNFCERLTTEGKTDCLNAGVDTPCKEAHLMIEELVISREIYSVYFHRLAERVCNKNLIKMVTKSVPNYAQVPGTAKLKFTYKETKSTTWNTSVSMKGGVKTTITAGVPSIVDGKIEISAELTAGLQWGKTETTESQVETEDTFPVPPMRKVKVSLLVRQGTCNVPFSYTQRDTLMNGKTDTLHFDDGIYTGVNSIDFEYDITTENL